MKWIVVQTKSLCEFLAIRNLEESGFRCYCPRLALRTHDGLVLKPMFAGYIFAQIEPEDVGRWRKINSHRGVYKILASPSGHPAMLPDGLVEKLIAQGDAVEDLKPFAEFTKGQKIHFTTGPLQGINGIVHWSNKERVSLLVNLLGMDTIVQSSAHLLAPAE